MNHICLESHTLAWVQTSLSYNTVLFRISLKNITSVKMNSKLVIVVLMLAIFASTFVPQSEAFTMGAGGVGGKRQLESCEEVQCLFVLISVHYFLALPMKNWFVILYSRNWFKVIVTRVLSWARLVNDLKC